MTLNLVASGGTWYLPPQASSVAAEVDWLFNWISIVTIFFTVLIFGLMFYFMIKYRYRKGNEEPQHSTEHNNVLEVTWTAIPTLIVLVIFFYGFRGYLVQLAPPPNAMEIQVSSWMWGWGFTYPNGVTTNQLVLPKDKPVRLVMTSNDVIHALYIPSFRVQKMTVPGRYNRFWVQGTLTTPPGPDGKPIAGSGYAIYCAQYCGTSHAEMIAEAFVVEPAEFERYLEIIADPTGDPPATIGEALYRQKGCNTCHSVDGTSGTGPTFKNVFGSQRTFHDGSTAVADEDYVRESILAPQKRVVKGFGPPSAMATFQLKDREIDWIIAYLKTISESYSGPDVNDLKTKPAKDFNNPAWQPNRPAAAPAN